MSSGGEDDTPLNPDEYVSDGPTGAPDDPEASHLYGPWFPGAPANLVGTRIPKLFVPPTYEGFEIVRPEAPSGGAPEQIATQGFDPTVATWNRWKKVGGQSASVPGEVRDCVVPTPGVTRTVAEPVVTSAPPPHEMTFPPVLRAALRATGLTQAATDTAKFFWYRGEKLPTKFPVTHDLIPTPANDKNIMWGYRQGYRKEVPSACFVHTTDGTRTTDARRVRAAFESKIKVGKDGAAAHIIINPSGHVYQVFDLAKLVAHVGGADGEYNLTTVSVEFMVPLPAKDSRTYQRLLEEGPWPSQAPWRWSYSKADDASKIYRVGPLVPFAFQPTAAQKDAFKRVADAFTTFGWFSPEAVPRPKDNPNTAVRTVDPDVALRWFRSGAWTYFHHAQVTSNRTDAAGVDLPGLLGLV